MPLFNVCRSVESLSMRAPPMDSGSGFGESHNGGKERS